MAENAHFHQLLGNRAAAFDDAACVDIPAQRPEDAQGIEAGMAIEVPVLDADHGIYEIIGKIGPHRVGELERANAPERLAIRGFEEERRLAAPGDGPFRRKIVKRPKHGTDRCHRANHDGNGERLAKSADGAPECGPLGPASGRGARVFVARIFLWPADLTARPRRRNTVFESAYSAPANTRPAARLRPSSDSSGTRDGSAPEPSGRRDSLIPSGIARIRNLAWPQLMLRHGAKP
jgi:hypothetical protein